MFWESHKDSYWLQPGLAMTSTMLAQSSVLTYKKEEAKNILRQGKKVLWELAKTSFPSEHFIATNFQEKALSSIRLCILLSKINRMGERWLTLCLPPQMHPIMTFLLEASTPPGKSVLLPLWRLVGAPGNFSSSGAISRKTVKVLLENGSDSCGENHQRVSHKPPPTHPQPVSLLCGYRNHTDEPRIWSHIIFGKKGNWMGVQVLMSQTSPKTGLQTNRHWGANSKNVTVHDSPSQSHPHSILFS